MSGHENIFCVTYSLWGKPHQWWIPLTKGQWCRAFMFSLIYAWASDWTYSGFAGDLRHNGVHVTSLINRNVFILTASWALKLSTIDDKAVRNTGIILGMDLANERRCYCVTPSLTGRAHTQDDPWNQDFFISNTTWQLTGKLWGVFCEDFGENWLSYNDTVLYVV